MGCWGRVARGGLFLFWRGWYRGQGPLQPQVPDFSVGAGRGRDGGWVRLLVVGGRSGRWSVRGGVPTLERGNDQHDETISMVRAKHPLGRAWGEGDSGVVSSRGGVLGKQKRPGSGGCRAGWDAGVRRGDQAWVLRRRATAARPARPVPKSSMVAGSGTGAVPLSPWTVSVDLSK